MKIRLNLKRLVPTRRTLILIGSIGLFLFSVSRILQSDTAVLPQAGAAANVEARTSAAEPATGVVAIEQLQVGQRVRADAPTDELDLQFGTEVVSEDWRKLTLLAPKRDGSTADVVLLRPLTWLNEQQAEVGGTVFISVPECGIDGHAQVLAIQPCPEILPGDGRVITGTFRHQVSASISLSIAGQAEPIHCTGNHPFWSEDRHDFVRADSLQPNETLRTTTGTTTVTSLTHIPGSTAVYNLEIHGTHVYHVGSSGILVHNSCITWSTSRNGAFDWDHVFSEDHVRNGIMNLGRDKGQIMESISDTLHSASQKGLLRVGPNQIETVINGQNSTIRAFFDQHGNLLKLNAWPGISPRKLGNLINL